MGTTRRLKELNPKIQCISMQPDSPFNGLEGLKHMATAIVPKIYDPDLADRNIEMATERAYAMAKHLGRNQGVLVGVSAAAATAAALQIAEEEAAAGTRGRDCHHPVRWRGQVHERTLLDGGVTKCFASNMPTTKHCARMAKRPTRTSAAACCSARMCRRRRSPAVNHVRQIVRAGNTRTDSAHNRYNIAPQELVKIQRQARGLGLDIVGFYHSHPDHPAQWSTTDFAEAHWLGCSYVITSVEKGKAAHDEFLSADAERERTTKSLRMKRLRSISLLTSPPRGAQPERQCMKIHIPTPLRSYTGGLETVSIPATTVDAAFQQLTVTYPELKPHLFTPEGKLRSFVNVYLNDDDIRYLAGKQETAVKDSDELTIIPSIAGG